MAFGNGAPDIFSSMASVLSVDEPKVGLAIGGLVGMLQYFANLECCHLNGYLQIEKIIDSVFRCGYFPDNSRCGIDGANKAI
jgi:Ca2+/Na+ antiporter